MLRDIFKIYTTDRIGEREPGNKPKPGDRIKYAFIENKNEKLLGNRIETPEYIKEHKLLFIHRNNACHYWGKRS